MNCISNTFRSNRGRKVTIREVDIPRQNVALSFTNLEAVSQFSSTLASFDAFPRLILALVVQCQQPPRTVHCTCQQQLEQWYIQIFKDNLSVFHFRVNRKTNLGILGYVCCYQKCQKHVQQFKYTSLKYKSTIIFSDIDIYLVTNRGFL